MMKSFLKMVLLAPLIFGTAQADQNNLPERLKRASTALLGTPAGWAPPQRAELIPLKETLDTGLTHLNCVTFVESVMAQAYATSKQDFPERLRQIRYQDGDVSFLSRHHFIETEWLPYQIKQGRLTDRTQAIGESFDQNAIEHWSVAVDRHAWLRSFYPAEMSFKQESTPSFKRKNTLTVVPFQKMWTPSLTSNKEDELFFQSEKDLFDAIITSQDALEKKELKAKLDLLRREQRLKGAQLKPEFIGAMPEVSLAILVKPDHGLFLAGEKVTDMLVTHMGIIVKRNDQLFFRHAPAQFGMVVTEVSFEEYFTNFLASGSNEESIDQRQSQWRGLAIFELK